jgi:5-deoxy-D-glucuronate isomerase
MASIIPFLPEGSLRDSVFEAHEITAMSAALGKVCEALNLQDDSSAKQTMAARIINLARRGECSPSRLCHNVLQEASSAEAAPTDVSAV